MRSRYRNSCDDKYRQAIFNLFLGEQSATECQKTMMFSSMQALKNCEQKANNN